MSPLARLLLCANCARAVKTLRVIFLTLTGFGTNWVLAFRQVESGLHASFALKVAPEAEFLDESRSLVTLTRSDVISRVDTRIAHLGVPIDVP